MHYGWFIDETYRCYNRYWNQIASEKVDRYPIDETYTINSLLTFYPIHIIDNLYLGSSVTAAFYKGLKSHNIKHIINITEHSRNYFPEEIDYLTIKIEDQEDEKITPYLDKTCDYIKQNKNDNILIHCHWGRSRSVALILNYLINEKNKDLTESILLLKEKRPGVSINKKFIEEIVNKKNIE